MADEEKKEESQEKESKASGGKKSGMLIWVGMCLGVVVVGAGAGMAAGMLFGGGSSQPQEDPMSVEEEQEPLINAPPRMSQDFQYYEFDSLLVNLNVPRQNRYIKVHIVLAIPPDDFADAQAKLDKKRIELQSDLSTYLSGLTLDEVSGRKNRVTIAREIANTINDQLWPSGPQPIAHVLFKDFSIQ